jgi:deazaflavin-dependent oxidoreductase (nitroreductase family)
MSHRASAMTPLQERLSRLGMQHLTALGIVAYRLSGGRVAGRGPGGAPICLLTTTGRRSGRHRCVPLLFVPLGDELVVVASRGGMGTHPAWYLNLLADPDVDVEIGRLRIPMRARLASPAERAMLWPRLVSIYGRFSDYAARAGREIPVVLLGRRGQDDPDASTGSNPNRVS